jgi:hypothetical protein
MIKKNKKKTIIYILVGSWVILSILGLILLNRNQVKLLKDGKLDPLPSFEDYEEYNFTVIGEIDQKYSPLFTCNPNRIPKYLDNLSNRIDGALERLESSQFIRWRNQGGEDVIVYNIDSTVLNLYLSEYKGAISFDTVEGFVADYLDPKIEYWEIKEQGDEKVRIYTANRKIGESELVTGFGKSDFFMVEEGSLTSARVLLADIVEQEAKAPLVNNIGILESYINNPLYPKNIVINSSTIFEATPQNYEEIDLDYEYESCVVNDIQPKLYLSNCNQNYLYYVYKIGGVCDINYENSVYSVSYQGFINAIDPEYVKSLE